MTFYDYLLKMEVCVYVLPLPAYFTFATILNVLSQEEKVPVAVIVDIAEPLPK
jgi:hypothetical protein